MLPQNEHLPRPQGMALVPWLPQRAEAEVSRGVVGSMLGVGMEEKQELQVLPTEEHCSSLVCHSSALSALSPEPVPGAPWAYKRGSGGSNQSHTTTLPVPTLSYTP